MLPQNGGSFLEAKVIRIHVAWLLGIGWSETEESDARAGPAARPGLKGLPKRGKLHSIGAIAEFTKSTFVDPRAQYDSIIRPGHSAFDDLVCIQTAADSNEMWSSC